MSLTRATIGIALALVAVLVPPLWLLVRLRRDNAAMGWWIAYAIAGVLGLARGIWCGFFASYDVNSVLRLHGVPLPFASERLVDGVWRLEHLAPPLLTGTLDVLLIAGLAHLPAALLYLLLDAWRKATRPRGWQSLP